MEKIDIFSTKDGSLDVRIDLNIFASYPIPNCRIYSLHRYIAILY